MANGIKQTPTGRHREKKKSYLKIIFPPVSANSNHELVKKLKIFEIIQYSGHKACLCEKKQ